MSVMLINPQTKKKKEENRKLKMNLTIKTINEEIKQN